MCLTACLRLRGGASGSAVTLLSLATMHAGLEGAGGSGSKVETAAAEGERPQHSLPLAQQARIASKAWRLHQCCSAVQVNNSLV